MLNPKKLFSEDEKEKKVENFVHFEKNVFFAENDTFGVFRSFRSEKDICVR